MTEPELVESRRLTGPNLLLDSAGSVLEVEADGIEHDTVVAAWRRHLGELLTAVGWGDAQFAYRSHATGLTLAFSAPIDVLYSACELHEAAWARVVEEFGGRVDTSFAGSGIDPTPRVR